jgi:hypothetical protein
MLSETPGRWSESRRRCAHIRTLETDEHGNEGVPVRWDLRNSYLAPSDHIRAPLRQKFPQDGSVAAALVLAVAAQREIRMTRQRCQQVQFPAPIGLAHLPSELPPECGPRSFVSRSQRFFHQFSAWRQVREPDIIVVESAEVGLSNPTRRPPHRAEPQTFSSLSRRAKSDDEDRHKSSTPSVPRGVPGPGRKALMSAAHRRAASRRAEFECRPAISSIDRISR